MRYSFTFNTTRSIFCEPGALKRLGEICRGAGLYRPLIVTDKGIVQLGMLQQLEAVLTEAELPHSSFSEVVADPPESVIHAAVAQAREDGADGIIGFGGGSSMDTAKLVALITRSGEALSDIYGVEKAKGERLPLILIPTTAGTGSEVTAVAVVTTGETTKAGVVSKQLYPDAAILDAELTSKLPAHITAATGVDAIVHAIEAYTSAMKKNPYSDLLAREAIVLLTGNIETATREGGNLEARQAMLLGACLAGQAFANAPVAAVHALAYPLGGHYHLPHGLTNSLVLPHVLRFNAPAAAHLYAELATLLIPERERADADADADALTGRLIGYFEQLLQRLNIPTRLRDLNIPKSDLPMLAADALRQQRLLVNNPRKVTEADALAIYQCAY